MHRKLTTLFLSTLVLLLTRGVASADDVDDDENFREDVIRCEDAVARIAVCCPNVSAPKQACVHHLFRETTDCGCGDSVTREEHIWPVLGLARSKEISGQSCLSLVADDGCSRLAQEISITNSSLHDDGDCSDLPNDDGFRT